MKFAILSAMAFLSVSAVANAQDTVQFNISPMWEKAVSPNHNNIKYVNFDNYNNSTREDFLPVQFENELTPTYLNAYTTSGLWKQGWFLSVSGGASAFVGDPLGCEDLFGRIKPTLQFGLGKWIIPSFGVRLQYQGLELTNGCIVNQKYYSLQTDLMLDVASLWYKGQDAPRATIIPFAGLGVLHNEDADTHPFSLHYGLIGSLRLSRHLSMNLEVSSMNTFKNFDGVGSKCELGDQLLNATLGLSYTLGSKHNQRRVVDATQYIEQNRRLLAYNDKLWNYSKTLEADIQQQDLAISEYNKILSIKGWLDKNNQECSKDSKRVIGYPYNNYSGLNSLRDRLRNKAQNENDCSEEWNKNNENDQLNDSMYDSLADNDSLCGVNLADNNPDYLKLVLSRKICLGAPILFFFNLNSSTLTDESQRENIREIATVVNKYNLHVKVIGAADSATGTTTINQSLSECRASFIEDQLINLGVSPDHIHKSAAGGINSYHPSVANRNTRVELYL